MNYNIVKKSNEIIIQNKISTEKFGMAYAKKGHIEYQKFYETETNRRYVKTLALI